MLRGCAVWSGRWGTVAAAAVGLAVALLRHAVRLLGRAAVAHLLAISATAVATASTATAARAGVGGLVDADGPSVEPRGRIPVRAASGEQGGYGFDLLDVVHGLDGLLGILLVAVTDETESTAPASVTVLDDHLLGWHRPLVRLSLRLSWRREPQ